jgi:hypothetical protein
MSPAPPSPDAVYATAVTTFELPQVTRSYRKAEDYCAQMVILRDAMHTCNA